MTDLSDLSDLPRSLEPDESGDGTFTIGPPEAVTDSRNLPAVSDADETTALTGIVPPDHPDNVDLDSLVTDPDPDAGEPLPTDADLDALVAGVDTDRVDPAFDGADAGAGAPGGA